MRLNNAVIVNRTLDGIQVTSAKDFIRGLLSAKDLVADVFVNTRLLFTCVPSIREDNCWLIAYIDGRFALSAEQPVESILVKVHQKDSNTIIFESLTPINNIISENDADADLNFGIMSTSPNSTMKCNLPDSRFQPLLSEKLNKKALSSQPSVNSLIATASYTESESTLQIRAITAGAAGNSLVVTLIRDEDDEKAVVKVYSRIDGEEDEEVASLDNDVEPNEGWVSFDDVSLSNDTHPEVGVTLAGNIAFSEVPAHDSDPLEIQLTGGEDSYYGA